MLSNIPSGYSSLGFALSPFQVHGISYVGLFNTEVQKNLRKRDLEFSKDLLEHLLSEFQLWAVKLTIILRVGSPVEYGHSCYCYMLRPAQ